MRRDSGPHLYSSSDSLVITSDERMPLHSLAQSCSTGVANDLQDAR